MPDIAVLRDELPYVSAAQYASLQAAITAIGVADTVLTLPPGIVRTLTANLTIPANVTLDARLGTIVTNGFNLIIEGPFVADPRQVFDTSGGGSVIFTGSMPSVLPSWWNDAVNGTDVRAAIIAAINSIDSANIGGGTVLILGKSDDVLGLSDSVVLPPRIAGDNHGKWYVLRGPGRGGPRITALAGMANKAIIDAAGSLNLFNFYREIRDMYLNGAAIAQVGVDIQWAQHFKVENMFITNLSNGAGQAAGVVVQNSLCAQFRDVKVHNSQGHGIFAAGGSAGFFNANLIIGCSMLDLTGDGLNMSGTWTATMVTGNTFEKCRYGIYSEGFNGMGVVIVGNYLELNTFADIFLGASTFQVGTVVDGNYLNGYNGAPQNDAYTPILLKFAQGVKIRDNVVNVAVKSPNGYYLLDVNMPGASVVDTVVEGNSVRDLPSSTRTADVYNIPVWWAQARNKLRDGVFVPLIETNYAHTRLMDGWTISTSGAGTVEKGAGAPLFGVPVWRLFRPAASTVEISKELPVGAAMRNRFVTLAVPLRALSDNIGITIRASPNGTLPLHGGGSTFSQAIGTEEIVHVTCYVPADATTITMVFTLLNSGADYEIGQPCLYVGAERWYSAGDNEATRASAAPTTGTWKRGDIVWNSAPVAGGIPGWMCVTAGVPGTWKAMAALAP